jgi:lipopolysaccharide/colanic/teichoic acid biosynthesis glycosyltransferase
MARGAIQVTQVVDQAMLFELPRKALERADVENAPEAGHASSLRRDIAGSPLISCNPVVGGWLKRGFDLVVLAITLPVWGGFLVAKAAPRWLKKQSVFSSRPCVGYGGRAFVCFGWHDEAPGRAPLGRLAPLLLNVARGEMSLVGPLPRSPDEVSDLRAAARHYLSARPGMFGVRAVTGADTEVPSHYKAYALSWSLLADAVILWQELKVSRREPAE